MHFPMTPNDRRTMLKATGVTLVGASLGGCLANGLPGSSTDGTTGESGDDSTDESGNDSQADVTVGVGAGDNLTFDPKDLQIRPGTTVAWEWESDTHNIVVDEQPDDANWNGTPGPVSKLYDTGYRYTHTFDVLGSYDYYCAPHKAADMTGTVAVTTGKDDEPTVPEDHATEDDLPVEVGPDGDLEFTPGTERPLAVPAGTDVTFVWKSDGGNIVVDEQPDDANWNGTPGGTSKIYDEGYEYAHTFDIPGKYEFHSAPHEAAGMDGTIFVTE